MAKILVVCARRYNGHELWTALGVFNERGHTFEVTSTSREIKDELTFQPNSITRLVYDVSASEFTGPLKGKETWDALVIVSGNMKDTEEYWKDPHIKDLLVTAKSKEKVVAAICCSVPTLASVAKGVQVSFFPLQRSRRILTDAGAILRNVALTVDSEHRVVTAEHQMASQMWAEEICNLLEDKPPQYVLKDSGYVPKGRERRLPKEVQAMIDKSRT